MQTTLSAFSNKFFARSGWWGISRTALQTVASFETIKYLWKIFFSIINENMSAVFFVTEDSMRPGSSYRFSVLRRMLDALGGSFCCVSLDGQVLLTGAVCCYILALPNPARPVQIPYCPLASEHGLTSTMHEPTKDSFALPMYFAERWFEIEYMSTHILISIYIYTFSK